MPQTAAPLQNDAQDALLRLRGALGNLFDELATPVERAHQLQSALGIDKKLAWRVHNFVTGADVLAAAHHLPSSTGIDIVLDAALANGGSGERADNVRDAFDAYMGVIKAHAGERASMETMLASASPRVLVDAARTHQRNAFNANSFIWGAQAKLRLSSFFLAPSASDPGRVDIMAMRGLNDLRRIRPDLPWVFGYVRCVDDDGQIRLPLNLEPIDPQPDRNDGIPPVSLLPGFCSQPVPVVRRARGGDNHLIDELIEAPVGNAGVISCFAGEIARGAGTRYRDEHNAQGEMVVRVRTPVQWLLADVFMHRDILPEGEPTTSVYSDIAGMGAVRREPRDLLPISPDVQDLGSGRGAAYTPLLPRYTDMVDHAFARAGWDRSAFTLFRMQLEYPVMPSSVYFSWALPEPPAS